MNEILDMAESEGVAVSVRHGRLAYRGSSPALTALLKGHERAVVEHLGGEFRSPLSNLPAPPPITRTVGSK